MSKHLFYCGTVEPFQATAAGEGVEWLLMWAKSFAEVSEMFMDTFLGDPSAIDPRRLCQYNVTRVLGQHGPMGVKTILSVPLMESARGYCQEQGELGQMYMLQSGLNRA